MKVVLREWPTETDWLEVYARALFTEGKEPKHPPSRAWKEKILRARHSPIRRLWFAFEVECPYWVSVHLVRHHVGVNFFVRSQRNDRQSEYDRNAARQDAPVKMIIDINAEALITLANKRLCGKASAETREVVAAMCKRVVERLPEFAEELVPMCMRNGGVCHEMRPCGRGNNETD